MAKRGGERRGTGKPRAPGPIGKAVDSLPEPKVRVTGPDRSLPPVTIRVRQTPGMKGYQFRRKMDALRKLGEEGKLYKATNKVLRDKRITDNYRQDMIRRIHQQYGRSNPEFAERLIAKVGHRAGRGNNMQPDHVWELQLGGPDTRSNLQFTHDLTNEGIGNQIWQQIQNLPDGTPIRIEVIT